jgi:putative transposase
MAEYRHSAHAVYDIKYHIIWITKYRYGVLRGRVAERARDLIRQICEAREVVVIRGAVSPDHIHMLVSAPPQLAPSKLVQYIKGRSSRRLQEEFEELRKRYWGQQLWARGYFCATVGAVDEETIKKYIESQQWHDDQAGFKITAPTKP